MLRKALLVDTSLYSYSGHCLQYLLSLAEILKTSGFEVHIAGHRSMAINLPNDYVCHAVFSYMVDGLTEQMHSISDRLKIRDTHENAIEKELTDLCNKININNNDVVLINTVRQWPLRGIGRWLSRFAPTNQPLTSVILHFTAFPRTYGNQHWVSEMYHENLEFLHNLQIANLQFFADTKELVNEYNLYNSVLVKEICIPHVQPSLSETHVERDHNNKVCITYLGEARDNKGFYIIPSIFQYLQRKRYMKHISVEIQNFTFQPNNASFLTSMARLAPYDIKYYNYQLTNHEYALILDNADIVLLPYQLENYHSQSSGILAEAIGAGKRVLTTAGTWAGRQAIEFRVGACAPQDDWLSYGKETVRLIEEIMDNYINTKEAAARWTQIHSSKEFVKKILRTED